MDDAFGPDERAGILIVVTDEAGDVIDQLADAAEGGILRAWDEIAESRQERIGTGANSQGTTP